MKRALSSSFKSLGFVALLAACGSSTESPDQGGQSGASVGGNTTLPGAGVPSTPGAGAPSTPGGGTSSGAGAGNTPGAGSGTTPGAGSGPGAGAGGQGPVGGTGTGGSVTAGTGTGGSAGATPSPTPANVLVVSSPPDAYWKTDGMWTDAAESAAATVTVSDMLAQLWEGFGGSFNEMGWEDLTTDAMKAEAIKLLFSATDGANFAWGRIPMGASDYGTNRYTLVDPNGMDDPVPSGETNRPAADLTLTKFSLERDGKLLIPYIKAAQAVKSNIRFWASPWTPPVWMKTGFKPNNGGSGGGDAKRPSFYDGGTMKGDTAILASYAEYFKKFVEGYRAQGINVEVVSPQNEPGYDQNYPSCLWESATYVTFIRDHLGPAMKAMTPPVGVMLGTMSNAGDSSRNDMNIASAVLGDATAKSMVSVGGAQWGVLDRVNSGQANFGGLPVWATEHKCGNYPWNPSGFPAYNSTQAPNDQAYGEESWGYIRNAINQGKVTSYSAWNMVLDRLGLGNDTSRDWRQNALLVADAGAVKPTPAYWVFRHFSQYVVPGANVVSVTPNNNAVGFKNPDGSYVAVVFNSGNAAVANFVVAIGGKKVQFNLPSKGWATVKVTPPS